MWKESTLGLIQNLEVEDEPMGPAFVEREGRKEWITWLSSKVKCCALGMLLTSNGFETRPPSRFKKIEKLLLHSHGF
jgi:hypothetical protein